MLKNKKIVTMVFVGVICSFMFALMNSSGSVFAGKVTSIYKYINGKAEYQGIYNCYTKKVTINKAAGLSQYDVAGTVQLNSIKNAESVLQKNVYFSQPYAERETNSCRAIFKKFNKAPSTTNDESVSNFVTSMGYTISGSKTECYNISFKKDGGKKTYYTNKICPNGEGEGFRQEGNTKGQRVNLYVDGGNNKRICLVVDYSGSNNCKNYSDKVNWKNMKKFLKNLIKTKTNCNTNRCTSKEGGGKSEQVFILEPALQKQSGSKAKITSKRSTASAKAINYLSDGKYKNNSATKIEAIERRLLYQAYLYNYYGIKPVCNKESKDYGKSIKWYKKGKIETCYYTTTNAKNKDEKVNGVKDGFLKKKSIGLDGLVNDLNKNYKYSDKELDKAKAIASGELNKEKDGKDAAKEDNCLGAGSASGLNWIVCSVLDWITGAVEKIYNAVEGFLAIPVSLFADNPNTRDAWETFRNVANILFVILFLLVIFSQLTGVGIDNYGIKRILPKLIVIAILINLSYIICELVIDVSNLLGNGFLGLFRSFADSFNGATATVEDGTVGLDDALVGVSALGIVAGFGMVLANPAMLLTLFVSAIGVLMSVLFLFVLLSVREAAVLVLTVVSPIAVVLYAMPNTKSVFDKWLKFFEGLLLVYPIAGLLIGAGDYVARLLVSTGAADGMGIFAAIIVSVAPVFLIPTVLKHSFAAMGSIGSKLTGFGQTLSSGTTKRMRDSDTYKNIQEMGAEHATMRRAGVKMGKDGQYHLKTGVLANVMAGGSRLRARNLSRFLGDQKKLDEANGLLSDNGVGFEAASIAQRKGAEADMVANYVTKINDDTRNGENEGELFKLYDDYVKDRNKYGAAAVARIAGRRKDTAERFSKRVEGSSLTYNPEMMKAVSKEMATGENSSMYRQSSPMGFEFASQVNSGKARSQDYNEWLGQKQLDKDGNVDQNSRTNASLALEHHVTNNQELVGMKGKELEELYGLMQNGTVDAETSARISNLATQAIENRDKPGSTWDSTKADQLAHISGKYDYDSSTDTLTKRTQTT